MSHPEPTPAELAMLALRYAAGELAGAEAEAFEDRLAADGAAREILGETVRLSAAVAGVPAPAPQLNSLGAIRDRLFPTVFRRLFPIKSYRGHPAFWAGLGSLAVGLIAIVIELATEPPQYVATPSVRPGLPRPISAPETPATPPLPEPMQSTTPLAGMEPASPQPMPMPQPNPRRKTTQATTQAQPDIFRPFH